jgi:hypothetical protein
VLEKRCKVLRRVDHLHHLKMIGDSTKAPKQEADEEEATTSGG